MDGELKKSYINSIAPTINYINESANASYRHEVVVECFDALDEGFCNPIYLNEAGSSLASMMYEVLESVKTALLNIYESIIKLFESYILNSVSLIKKYKERILNIPEAKISMITYVTYTYPKLYSLPNKVFIPEMSESEKKAIVKKAMDNGLSDLKNWVDDELVTTANLMLDTDSVSLKDTFESAKTACYTQMRGKEVVERLNRHSLEKLIDEISEYKEFRQQLYATRREILEYYENMKLSINKTFEVNIQHDRSLRAYYDSDKYELTSKQTNNISSYTIEYNRLYNGIITLYNNAFNIKLDIFRNKIELNRKVILELLKSASVISNIPSTSTVKFKENGVTPPIKY